MRQASNLTSIRRGTTRRCQYLLLWYLKLSISLHGRLFLHGNSCHTGDIKLKLWEGDLVAMCCTLLRCTASTLQKPWTRCAALHGVAKSMLNTASFITCMSD